MMTQEFQREVELGCLVLLVERERRRLRRAKAEGAAAVVERARERDESAARLARARGIHDIHLEELRERLGVADEILRLGEIAGERVEAKGEGVAKSRKIPTFFLGSCGGDRSQKHGRDHEQRD